ncbi:tRNA-5-taurinomethyluridine 2-sulfurtransferase [Martiniozyma asiatica (nom. inval.)]|nr:tRNA-5-taurinomethyluridine 2-sulfurtransferase [Martiniozyma asiatica]
MPTLTLDRIWHLARTSPVSLDKHTHSNSSLREASRLLKPGPKEQDEIIVGLSSGVDSAVSLLLCRYRYPQCKIRGIFMANWLSDPMDTPDDSGGNSVSMEACSIDQDWLQVKQIGEQFDVPVERVNFEREYWIDVFEPMLRKYQIGKTPNPDIGCNKYVKFGKMVEYLNEYYTRQREMGGLKDWWLVTGHYARIFADADADGDGNDNLYRAHYKPKDQSYYLASIDRGILSKTILPVGDYTKPEIRAIAHHFGLVPKDKKDSQGICFISQNGKFKEFLGKYLPANKGNIVTSDGKVWGEHDGLWTGTIGQRSGVSMPQGSQEYKGVWMISDKDITSNSLVISKKGDGAFFKKRLRCVDRQIKDKTMTRWGCDEDVHWWSWMDGKLNSFAHVDPLAPWKRLAELVCQSPPGSINCQIRSLQTPNAVTSVSTFKDTGEIEIELENPQFGVAPGQMLAIYQEDRLLGSGEIVLAR